MSITLSFERSNQPNINPGIVVSAPETAAPFLERFLARKTNQEQRVQNEIVGQPKSYGGSEGVGLGIPLSNARENATLEPAPALVTPSPQTQQPPFPSKDNEDVVMGTVSPKHENHKAEQLVSRTEATSDQADQQYVPPIGPVHGTPYETPEQGDGSKELSTIVADDKTVGLAPSNPVGEAVGPLLPSNEAPAIMEGTLTLRVDKGSQVKQGLIDPFLSGTGRSGVGTDPIKEE